MYPGFHSSPTSTGLPSGLAEASYTPHHLVFCLSSSSLLSDSLIVSPSPVPSSPLPTPTDPPQCNRLPMSATSPHFPTTHWTLVQKVQEGDDATAAAALESICKAYWFPIYSFLRGSGKSAADAEDLTQALFAAIIRDDMLDAVRRDKGRLRSFLLGALRRVVSDDQRHHRALKRGGGLTHIELDAVAEERFQELHGNPQENPEQIYLRAWAAELLQTVRMKLRSAFEKKGRVEMFDIVEPYLGSEENQPPYEELARKLQSTPGAVKTLVYRLRKKYRELLEREIAMTVMKPEDIAEELAWLRQIVAE